MSVRSCSAFDHKSQLRSSFRNAKIFEGVSIEIRVGTAKIGSPCSLGKFTFCNEHGLDIAIVLIGTV